MEDALAGKRDGALREAFREMVHSSIKGREFYIASPKRYRGVDGIYEYGPPGSAIESNVLGFWREHFVLEEGMSVAVLPYPTPKILFKGVGHLDEYIVPVMMDEETGTCYRADHLLNGFLNEMIRPKNSIISPEKAKEVELVLATLSSLSDKELGAKIKEYGITRAPDTGNQLSGPYPFKVMHQDYIGPSGFLPEYVRPKTAQGCFADFKYLHEFKGNKLPFAVAHGSQAFREEISPQNRLLIIHEFTVTEIEHFVDPEDKSHPKFSEVADLELLMFPGEQQMSGQSAIRTRLGEAVSKGTVDNETLGYYIGRTFLFLTRLGIAKDHLRFSQRLGGKLAHDAADCWVAEIECSYGWIECVDIADRPAYELRAHREKSGVALVGREEFAEPREVAMGEEEALQLKAALESKGEVVFRGPTVGKRVIIEHDMVKISKQKIREHEYAPSVIEPSFGIGRIIYCLFEHSFYTRPSKAGNGRLNVFRFPPLIAPFHCTIFPLIIEEPQLSVAQFIGRSLAHALVKNRVDMTTGSTMGKRYAINDELGVPFAITVDTQVGVTIRERDSQDQDRARPGKARVGVTIRERDSQDQVRVSPGKAAFVVTRLILGQMTWSNVRSTFPHHTSASAEEDE